MSNDRKLVLRWVGIVVLAICLFGVCTWGDELAKIPKTGPVPAHSPLVADPAQARNNLAHRRPLDPIGPRDEAAAYLAAHVFDGFDDMQDYREYVNTAFQAADASWTSWFTGQYMPEPTMELRFLQGDNRYHCEPVGVMVTATSPQALYCYGGTTQMRDDRGNLADAVAALPLTSMAQQRYPTLVAIVTAAQIHGYHTAAEIGKNLQQVSSVPTGRDGQLLADCFAGVWLGTLVPLAKAISTVLNDPDATNLLWSVVAPLAQGHAEAAERLAAFQAGYAGTPEDPRSQIPANCFGYWPNFGK